MATSRSLTKSSLKQSLVCDVNFPIERDPADAWPDFVGWRLNYEQAAYSVAASADRAQARPISEAISDVSSEVLADCGHVS